MASDIYWDPVDDDISTDWRLTADASEEISQAITTIARTLKGQWGFDTAYGIDYPGIVWQKGTPTSRIVAEFSRAVAECHPAIVRVESISATRNPETRRLVLRIDVLADTTIVTVGLEV